MSPEWWWTALDRLSTARVVPGSLLMVLVFGEGQGVIIVVRETESPHGLERSLTQTSSCDTVGTRAPSIPLFRLRRFWVGTCERFRVEGSRRTQGWCPFSTESRYF